MPHTVLHMYKYVTYIHVYMYVYTTLCVSKVFKLQSQALALVKSEAYYIEHTLTNGVTKYITSIQMVSEFTRKPAPNQYGYIYTYTT